MPPKLVLISVLVGLAASVPLVHQAHPDLLDGLLEHAGHAPAQPPAPVLQMEARPTEPDRSPLSGRRVRLDADASGHFMGEFKLNGRKVGAMIDTGATLVAINETTARQIGLALKPSDFLHEVQTANGKVRAASATIRSIQIGRIQVEGVEAAVLEDSALKSTLVGLSFLQRLSRYQVERGELLLEQ